MRTCKDKLKYLGETEYIIIHEETTEEFRNYKLTLYIISVRITIIMALDQQF